LLGTNSSFFITMRSLAVLLFLVALAIAEAAPLLHADSPQAIQGSYLVILRDELALEDRDAHINALKNTIAATKADAEIGWSYGIGSFKGFSARLTPELLKAELSHPDVKYVEADQVVSIDYKPEEAPLAGTVTQTGATWGINRISQQESDLNGNYAYSESAGEGVDAYVIDTGILITHAEFDGRAQWGYSSVTNEANTDLNGHGTHVSGTIGGTIFGIAKRVNLIAVKVLNSGGSGTVTGVIAGINYVTSAAAQTKRPSVANMSLGGGASAALDDAVYQSIESGVAYAIASGNNNQNTCNYSPARVSTSLSTGATTNTDERAYFSNFGTCTHVFAPGNAITSAWIGSNTATNVISGTSMAAPHVAGVLALRLSIVGGESTAQSKAWVLKVATLGKVVNPGTGSPNLLLFSDPEGIFSESNKLNSSELQKKYLTGVAGSNEPNLAFPKLLKTLEILISSVGPQGKGQPMLVECCSHGNVPPYEFPFEWRKFC